MFFEKRTKLIEERSCIFIFQNLDIPYLGTILLVNLIYSVFQVVPANSFFKISEIIELQRIFQFDRSGSPSNPNPRFKVIPSQLK